MKRIIFSTVVSFLLISCKSDIQSYIQISGAAQGTTYHITYLAGQHSNYREAIDSIFKKIDLSLSTYKPGSVISKMNRNDTAVLADDYFSDVFNKSMEVSEKTKGLFDVTVAPVINAYGFGFTKKEKVTKPLIDSLLRYIGYKKVRLTDRKLVKEIPQVMLDFNAIAQGYTVDVLSSFLESKGISHYRWKWGGS
jgi:FAD:protein FMN transferase